VKGYRGAPANRALQIHTLYRWGQCWEAVASNTNNQMPRPVCARIRADADGTRLFPLSLKYSSGQLADGAGSASAQPDNQ
jgi:hypothetical protein